MQDEKRPLMQELAYYLHKRNQIEIRRRRAKSKISYYEDVKRTIKEYKQDVAKVGSITRTIRAMDSTLSNESRQRMLQQLAAQKVKVEGYNSARNRPFKFMDKMGELNKRILKHKADYTRAKYDTAKLTCSTRKRVYRLTQLLQCTINYQFGTSFVQSVGFKDGSDGLMSDKFEALALEYEANKAVEKMLRSKE